MKIEYYILDPAGNITALVTTKVPKESYEPVAACIMKKHPLVEQVGFFNTDSKAVKLDMSGGEFCGNATMCAAALGAKTGKNENGKISVFTSPVEKPFTVTVRKFEGGFECECVFGMPAKAESCSFFAGGREYTFPLVSFNGITHIVADSTLSEETARGIIKPLAEKLGAKALGIMIYCREENSLAPLVYVPAVDSLFLENSCASGSCALAAVLPEFSEETAIKEPGGTVYARSVSEGIYFKTNLKIIGKYFEEI